MTREVKYKLLLNAANLHGGGGVQVAVSLIAEISLLVVKEHVCLVMSSLVASECRSLRVDLDGFASVHEINSHGMQVVNWKLTRVISQAETVFTVFGPLYLLMRPKNSVIGFAQPWIIYPDSEAARALPILDRLKNRIKYRIQRSFFNYGSRRLVVEAAHVKEKLLELMPGKPIEVIPNALNGVFLRGGIGEADELEEIPNSQRSDVKLRHCTLGYLGRAYTHKNLAILPSVKKCLLARGFSSVQIKVTLTEEEWMAQSEDFQATITNIGPLPLSHCIHFYRSLDGVIFPSFLECFSASPIEAMAVGVPLFASNRRFVRDFCGDIPFYFDPLDPEDVASAIDDCFTLSSVELSERLESGRRHAMSLPTANQRAHKLIQLLLPEDI